MTRGPLIKAGVDLLFCGGEIITFSITDFVRFDVKTQEAQDPLSTGFGLSVSWSRDPRARSIDIVRHLNYRVNHLSPSG